MHHCTRVAFSILTAFFLLLSSTQAAYFPDVPDTNRYSPAVNFLYELGLVEGNPDGTFAPTRSLNRAEFAKLVVLIAGDVDYALPSEPCFKDVPLDAWFAPYVCQAKELGLMKGDGGTGISFAPSRTLNTAETLAVMDRLFEWGSPESAGEWYDTYMAGAKMRNVSDVNLEAQALVQRQLFAEIMARSIVVYDAEVESFEGPQMYEDFFIYDEITAEDCVEGEYYDEEYRTCELDCSIEGVCEEAEAAVDALAEQITNNNEFVEGDASNILARYAVTGEILKPTAQLEHNEVWALFARLFPAEQRKDFNEFHIFSDGEANLLAAVALSELEAKKWILAVDIADTGNMNELTETLIHEFAHVLTLRTGQLRFDMDMLFDASLTQEEMFAELLATCKTLYTGEGCALEDSYLWQFYRKFWQPIAASHPIKDAGPGQVPPSEAVAEYYETHQSDFVTGYAATAPWEDIAESFTFFVVKDKPTGSTNAELKIAFFWDFPELVSLRTYIRNKLR